MSAIACRAHLEPGSMPGCSKDDREHFTDGTTADFQLDRQEEHTNNIEHVDMIMSLVFQQASEPACLSRPMYTEALAEGQEALVRLQGPSDLRCPVEDGETQKVHDFPAAEPDRVAASCGQDLAHVPSGSSPAYACGTAAQPGTNDRQSHNREKAGAEQPVEAGHECFAFVSPSCPSSNEHDVDLPIKSALKKKRPRDSPGSSGSDGTCEDRVKKPRLKCVRFFLPDLHRSEPYWPGGRPRDDAFFHDYEEVEPAPAPVVWAPPPGSFRSAKRGRKKAPASSSQ